MLQEDMKKAIQAKRRTPPAGFEARSDMQILKLTAETKPGRRMPRAAVILCVILAVMGLATTLAATVDMVNSRLHALWPEAAEFLMPVDMSSEAEGIRMEVISAVVKDNKAMITFSLQDLEGDRLSEHTAITSGSEAFPRSDEEQYTVDGPLCLSYDAAEKKGVYAQVYDFEPELISEDYEIPLLIDSLETVKVDETDLRPMLEQYGRDVKTAEAPGDARALRYRVVSTDGSRPETATILDPSANLKIPLNEHVELSGIGWIDGMLHVQIHYPDHVMKKISRDTEYFPTSCWLRMYGVDGISPWHWHPEKLPDGVIGWEWDENGDEIGDWEEYIFPCEPIDVEEGVLRAELRDNTSWQEIKGNWSVKIPMKRVQFQEGN